MATATVACRNLLSRRPEAPNTDSPILHVVSLSRHLIRIVQKDSTSLRSFEKRSSTRSIGRDRFSLTFHSAEPQKQSTNRAPSGLEGRFALKNCAILTFHPSPLAPHVAQVCRRNQAKSASTSPGPANSAARTDLRHNRSREIGEISGCGADGAFASVYRDLTDGMDSSLFSDFRGSFWRRRRI